MLATLRVSGFCFVACSTWFGCFGGHACAGTFEDALRLVPANATSAVVVASVKSASDDLQLAIDRMGKAEAALGGRPIDLLKAQAGIGPGFDDRGALVAWTVAQTNGFINVAAFPVTDADAFIASTFIDAPELGAGAKRARTLNRPVWIQKTAKHVLVADSIDAAAGWEAKDGFQAVLESRLGRRGMEIIRVSDGFAWASAPVMKSFASMARNAGALDLQAANLLPGGNSPEAAPAAALETMGKSRERTAALLEQITDGVIAIDFDALAVGVRAFARFAPESEIAKAIPRSGASSHETQSLVSKLPDANFYGALGIDLRAMGGISHVRSFLSTIPGSERVEIPQWLDGVQDKVDQLQIAAYPSRLGISVGGILNDASFVIVTKDPAAVKAGLKSWITLQAGEANGIRREPTWEDARQLKNGNTVSAFMVKEVATGPGGDITERLIRQLIISSRGLHGFAQEVPGALVVTYSQRTDVLDRAVAAAQSETASTKTLAKNGMVRAMIPWLLPDADAMIFVGMGPLLNAAREVAQSIPGGVAEMIPASPDGLEPIAAALRSKDETWESSLVIPAGVLGVAFDAAKARVQAQP